MKPFSNRIQLTSSQRNEVQTYLGCLEVLTEESILKLVRKMKQLEQRLEEQKYA